MAHICIWLPPSFLEYTDDKSELSTTHIKSIYVGQVFDVSPHLEEVMMVEVCTGMDMESEDQSSVWERGEKTMSKSSMNKNLKNNNKKMAIARKQWAVMAIKMIKILKAHK